MVASYRTAQCELYVGTSSVKADLIGSLDGALTVTGAVEIDRRRVIAAGGTIGVTADGINCGLTIAANLRYTAESKKLLTLVDGVLILARKDASYAYGLPVVVTAVPITSAAGAIVSIAATFAQSADGNAVSGALRTENTAINTGQEGYATTSSGVVRRTSGTLAVASGQYGVIGAPILAEGS